MQESPWSTKGNSTAASSLLKERAPVRRVGALLGRSVDRTMVYRPSIALVDAQGPPLADWMHAIVVSDRSSRGVGTRNDLGPSTGAVADAVCQVIKLTADSRRLEVKLLDAAKEIIEKHAGLRWPRHFARHGRQPAAPVQLATRTGQSIVYVVQDRTEGRAPSTKTIDALAEEVGAGAVKEDWSSRLIMSLNAEILSLVKVRPDDSQSQVLHVALGETVVCP